MARTCQLLAGLTDSATLMRADGRVSSHNSVGEEERNTNRSPCKFLAIRTFETPSFKSEIFATRKPETLSGVVVGVGEELVAGGVGEG